MKRVVVTGIGIVCGLGRGREEVWRAIQAGRPAFREPSLFDRGDASRAPVGEADLPADTRSVPGGDFGPPTRVRLPASGGRTGPEADRPNRSAGHARGDVDLRARREEIAGDLDPCFPPGSGCREGSRLERMVQWAAREALDQAGLTAGSATSSFGVALGTSNGGMIEAEEWFACELARRGGACGGAAAVPESSPSSPRGGPVPRARAPRSASAVLALPASCATDALAAWLGARGPRLTLTTACSSSAAAVALAAERIRDGEAAAMVAGGGDPLCRLTYAGFASLRLLDPEGCRPFDEKRRGLTLGEGAAVLVLEDRERAARRGARPLAEILGHGFSCDAWHMTGCHPEGRGMRSALEEALRRAGLPPSRVGYVNAHGTATPSNDAAEGRAIAGVLGSAVPVSSTKSLHGHLLGGSGAVEAAVTILALQHALLPATAGTAHPDPALAIDLVRGEARPARAAHAISNSFGFGGGNVVLVLGAPDVAVSGEAA